MVLIASSRERFSRQSHRLVRLSVLGGILLAASAITLWATHDGASSTPSVSLSSDSVSALDIPWKVSFAGQEYDFSSMDGETQKLWARNYYLETQQYQLALYALRANEYLPKIQEILGQNGLHADYQYVAVAESALRDKAKSAAQAAGIWQIMPATGRDLWLTVNALRDDRYSFETSTVAAAKHLARLKKDFGDDALAISAYNVGEGALNTMIKVQNTRNFFDLYLNEETASYFFRILAIKYAFEHPDTFGIPQHLFEHSFQETPYTEQEFADIPDLAELCKTLGVSYKQVRALNPWILTDELKQGPWKLKIPKNKKS